MPSKIIDLPDIGPVHFIKSTRSRSIRLSVSADKTRVSLPRWTPYALAIQFALQHKDWILEEQGKHSSVQLREGHKIGKLHTLHFERTARSVQLRSAVTPTKLVIPYHADEELTSATVQVRAEKAAIRALKREAEVILPQRLKELAEKHDARYRSVTVKQLKRRWGSCDSHGDIALNLFLMQLSWQQVDYVMCHELAHLKHMNHGSEFWAEVERMLPDAKMIAKKVRHTQPALVPRDSTDIFDDDMAY